MNDREQQAREAFEKALAAYLALPEDAYGKIIVHFGGNGSPPKPGIEAALPVNGRGGPQVARTPARIRMPR